MSITYDKECSYGSSHLSISNCLVVIPFHIPHVISHADAVVTNRLSALVYRADLGDPSAQRVVQ